MSEPIIQIENLSKKYTIGERAPYGSLREEIMQAITSPFKRSHASSSDNSIWALKEVSFDVEEGEILGIIGRNGAGKSTLLKILSRITEPTGGEVILRGRVASLLEVGTGFHPELTGRENILLNGALLGMSRQEIKSKFDEIVAFAEIDKFLDTPVKRYSSGMYVRLAFAVAAHLEPEILVIDEVLAVGDATFQKKCLGKMGDIARGGRTVLFVSHNMGAVSSLCSRAIILAGGELAADGNAAGIVSKYMELTWGTTGSSYNLAEERSGGAWIESAKLKSADGSDCATFLMTEAIVVECWVNVKEESNITLSVQIKEMNGSTVYHFPNGDADFNMPSSPGLHKIEVRIPPLNLYPEKYLIRLALTDIKTGIQEEVEKISFDIQQDYQLCARPLPRQAGLIFTVPQWSGNKDDSLKE